MKQAIFLFLTAYVLFQSCATTNESIKPDEIAKKVFSPAEMNGIIKMIEFVDSIVCDTANTSDVNQAYHAYFESLEAYIEKENKYPDFGLVKDSVKFRFLESLDQEAIDAIWRIADVMTLVRFRDTTLNNVPVKSLSVKVPSNFLGYMEKIGKSDSIFYHFHQSMLVGGDISPSIVLWFKDEHENYDFTIFKNRLWATVFLLRMGDPLDEKIERYLKEMNAAAL